MIRDGQQGATTDKVHKATRPFGVMVIALLLVFNGFLGAVQLGHEAYDVIQREDGVISRDVMVDVSQRLTAVEWITLPFSLAGIMLAVGLWQLRSWAWMFAMFLQGLYLAVQLYDYFQGEAVHLNLLVSVLTVLYLNQSEVQLVFRDHPTAPSSGSST